jgi:hypothetical protein
MPSSTQITSLRQLLAERFPTARRAAGRVWATGIPAVDEPAGGGLPIGALTEIVCTAPSCGGYLLLGQLLTASRTQRQRAALVDTSDNFDPGSFPADQLAHLVWVRGLGDVPAALAATDLLARDANLGLVVLDLRHASATALRRMPATLWYRLQRAVEGTDLALVVETPRALVPSAQLRFELQQPFTLATLEEERPLLMTRLTPQIARQRRSERAG